MLRNPVDGYGSKPSPPPGQSSSMNTRHHTISRPRNTTTMSPRKTRGHENLLGNLHDARANGEKAFRRSSFKVASPSPPPPPPTQAFALLLTLQASATHNDVKFCRVEARIEFQDRPNQVVKAAARDLELPRVSTVDCGVRHIDVGVLVYRGDLSDSNRC